MPLPWFRAKAWLGALGLAMGIAGMALERRALVGVAVVLLALAFLARFPQKQKP